MRYITIKCEPRHSKRVISAVEIVGGLIVHQSNQNTVTCSKYSKSLYDKVYNFIKKIPQKTSSAMEDILSMTANKIKKEDGGSYSSITIRNAVYQLNAENIIMKDSNGNFYVEKEPSVDIDIPRKEKIDDIVQGFIKSKKMVKTAEVIDYVSKKKKYSTRGVARILERLQDRKLIRKVGHGRYKA